ESGETKQVFHGPERGDVIVFRDPRNPDEDLIKRVIGLPGETVEIRNGVVYVNSQPLEEPYLERAWEGNKEARVIPADEFFVLGDNRSNSLDSRSDQIGLVHKDLIIGKATLAYWPSDKFASSLSDTPTCSPNPDCSAATDGSEIASSGR
ncbi:MAG: signal peptidase I, partial [Dehalococcoidia bacterium]